MYTGAVRAILLLSFLLSGCGEAEREGRSREAAEPVDVLGRFPMTADSVEQWKLPRKLKEISGLALSGDGRLFAVADEEAIIYELDYRAGRIAKAFALGSPTVRADFEGIAIDGERFLLTTSDGGIYETREGADGDRVTFTRYATELGEHCEIEGLAVIGEQLLLLCKKVRSDDLIDTLAIFRVVNNSGRVLYEDLIELPESEILEQLDSKRVHPSGLAIDPVTGHLLIVAAQERAVIEMTIEGKLVQAVELPLAARHRQAEGIEITVDGELLIGDEGGGKKARIAVYRETVAGIE